MMGRLESSKEYKILISLSHQFVQVLKNNKDTDTQKKKKRITIDVSRTTESQGRRLRRHCLSET